MTEARLRSRPWRTLTSYQHYRGDIDPVALKMMNAKLPNGQFLVPSVTVTDPNQALALGNNAVIQGAATDLTADQVNANIDYNLSDKDRLSGKYYFQTDPTTAPFIISQLGGFPQVLTVGSQVFSLENTRVVSANFTWLQRFGFVPRRLTQTRTSNSQTVILESVFSD